MLARHNLVYVMLKMNKRGWAPIISRNNSKISKIYINIKILQITVKNHKK